MSSNKKYNFGSFRVLVVDDNANMRKIIRGLLNGFGIREIVEIESDFQVMEELNNNIFDLILIDWMLREKTALDVIKNVRSNSSHPYVPIVIVSGYASKKIVITARDAGATEFITKPLSAATLFTRIAHIVDHPRSFIETQDYFGPDRRRKIDLQYSGRERRLNNEKSGEAMSQEEIDSMMRF